MTSRLLTVLTACALVAACSSPQSGRWNASPASSPKPTPSATASPTPSPTAAPKPVAGCPLFPPDNIWHADVSGLPVHPQSAAYVATMGPSRRLHPDFGSGTIDGSPFGIPITDVPAGTPGVKVTFDYADESDAGPYPIPANVKVEGGSTAEGDRHVILHDRTRCTLYELYAAEPRGGGWHAGSGAVFDLRSNALRPKGWTSADAAGLPIMAGLVQYDEVKRGRVDHAIRITAPRTHADFVWPARHAASERTDPALPPMGLRLRLKADTDISGFTPQSRVIAQAMKTYGVILADNGSAWFLTGTSDDRWNNEDLGALKTLRGESFEAVDVSGLMVDENSGAVRR